MKVCPAVSKTQILKQSHDVAVEIVECVKES